MALLKGFNQAVPISKSGLNIKKHKLLGSIADVLNEDRWITKETSGFAAKVIVEYNPIKALYRIDNDIDALAEKSNAIIMSTVQKEGKTTKHIRFEDRDSAAEYIKCLEILGYELYQTEIIDVPKELYISNVGPKLI